MVFDLSFSPDGRRLASSGADGRALLWDVETGQELASFEGLALDFSPDGLTLAIGGSNYPVPAGATPDARTVRLYHAPALEGIERKR